MNSRPTFALQETAFSALKLLVFCSFRFCFGRWSSQRDKDRQTDRQTDRQRKKNTDRRFFPVLWAQRSSKEDAEKNFIYLTIVVPDADPSQAEIALKPTSVSFKGFSKTLKRTYAVTLDLYAEIDEAASKVNHTSRSVELKLVKKELKEEYWPRLLKDSKKVHFLKTDFDKWVDEDEQDEAPADDFSQFGGMGGGMGGMGGGMGGMPGMGGTYTAPPPFYNSLIGRKERKKRKTITNYSLYRRLWRH